MIDNLFLLAVGAFGWGLSLATYRYFAQRNSWSMGALHADMPLIPIMLGLGSLSVGFLYATYLSSEFIHLIPIVGCGLLLAMFWTGFLRVGSQISLFLAPLAAALLLLGWSAIPLGFGYKDWAHKRPADLFSETDRRR